MKNKHPNSLYLLFATEMWERFSFYGMRALLVLYLVDKVETGGQGWSRADASSLYGTYLSTIYLSSILGGYLADKFLGYRKAVLWGGFIIVLGHISLALNDMTFFYAGIGLLIAGTGLLKPNISSMVGQLYPDGSSLKDSAYTIFYMGINLGGFFGPIVCGELARNYGWHYGFGIAAFGMILGLIIFYFKQDMLGDIGLSPKQIQQKIVIAPPKQKLTKIEIDRLIVIGILSFFSIVFWMSFEQAGASINIFAKDYTDKHIFGTEISAASFQSVNSMWILILSLPMSWLWVKLDQAKKNPSSPYKFAFGLLFLGLAFVLMAVATSDIQQGAMTASKSAWLLIAFYGIQTVGEMCISPVGLATVNKLSPPALFGSMYGVWFGASAVGNYFAGFLSSRIDELQTAHSMSYFFGIFVVATFVMSALAFVFGKKLTAMMHGVK